MSQRWTLDYAPAAVRFLERLREAKLSRRLQIALESLQTDPRPHNSIKLSSEEDLYRIIYSVKDTILLVLVVDIGHRREIYR